jgi:hypothetical protein
MLAPVGPGGVPLALQLEGHHLHGIPTAAPGATARGREFTRGDQTPDPAFDGCGGEQIGTIPEFLQKWDDNAVSAGAGDRRAGRARLDG